MPEEPVREDAFRLLNEYTKNESLIKHALAVEAVMRHFARRFGQDERKWAIIGLAHDIDYEQFPDQHCRKAPELLGRAGWPADWIRSVVSHGWGICSDVEPVEIMEKVLYAVDELTGLIKAAALMRPSRSILDLEASSVKKRWKEKRFSAGVDRSVIERGAAMAGIQLDELISETILAMRSVAAEIGLQGSLPAA
jgi:predicted hydrolase (HD superfamily)